MKRSVKVKEHCSCILKGSEACDRGWMTGTLRLTGQRRGRQRRETPKCGGSEGGKAGLARVGAEGETGRGGSAPRRWKLLCLGDSAMQGFGSSAWEMFVKSSQQNATHVLGRIFAFWRGSQAFYGRWINYRLGVCVYPHISPQHSLKEHPEGTFPFYWVGRLFWVYHEPVCIIEVTLRDLVCLYDINNTCFPKATIPGPTGNLGVSEEM